jgi:uridine kinase
MKINKHILSMNDMTIHIAGSSASGKTSFFNLLAEKEKTKQTTVLGFYKMHFQSRSKVKNTKIINTSRDSKFVNVTRSFL